jgi:hypothetical protein
MPVHKLIIAAALTAANMALTMTKRIEGQRLDDLKYTGGDYGAPTPNVFGLRRLQLQIFFAEDLTETRQTRKTKGGKFNDYTYSATFALLLAGHEIAGLRRLWADKHLVFDLSGAGPITPFQFVTEEGGKGSGGAGDGGFAFGDHLAIYLGTETQEADPRMLATIEGLHGVGSCPAYRGTAYAMLRDLPLEKFGNRIPQCEGEVTGIVEPNYPWESMATLIDPPINMFGFTFSSDYSRFVFPKDQQIEMWDTAARGRMISATLAPVLHTDPRAWGMKADGRFYAPGELLPASGNQKFYLVDADLGNVSEVLEIPSSSYIQHGFRVCVDASGDEHWLGIPWSTTTRFYVDGIAYRMLDLTAVDWIPTSWFADSDGSIWAAGRQTGGSVTEAYFHRMISAPGATGPDFVTVTGLAANGSALENCDGIGASDGNFVLVWGTALYRIEAATGAVLDSLTGLSFDPNVRHAQVNNLPPGSSSIWLSAGNSTNTEYSLTTLTALRTVTLSDWKSETATGQVFDPVNHALLCAPGSADLLTWRYLDRIGIPSITLGDIAENICEWAGVTNYDFADLDQTITGWSFTQGDAANVLEPLFDLYDAEIRPHGFQVQGIKRSGVTSGASLSTPYLVAGDARYTIKIRQPAELPQAVVVNFADIDADQQPNSTPPADDALGAVTLDMTTLAIDATSARGLAERMHRRIWNERVELSTTVTAQHLALEPGDCRTIDLDGEARIYRCLSTVMGKTGTIQTEWRRDHPSLAVIDGTAGASFDGRDESTVIVPLLSKGFVLDIPLLSDLDEATNPVLYLAAAPFAAGTWPGASIYQETGGEYTDEVASLAAADAVTWGYTSAALGSPGGGPWLWDRLSEVEVVLQNGSLTGTTEAAIDADATLNLALIGSEVLQFTTATLTAPLTYTLSGFKRGRKGSESFCDTHATREVFLLLSEAEAAAVELSAVGTDLSFKAVTSGRTEAGAFAIDLEPFAGVSKKPYAPTHLTELLDTGSGDWTLAWTRRSRIGATWTGGTSIPLGEASEEYEVDIMDGVTVVRTITVSSPTTTYTAAQQTTDFGAPQTSLDWHVYQISDAVGRGYQAAA